MPALTLTYAIAGLIFTGVAVLVIAAIVDSRAARLRERMERVQSPGIMAGSPLAQELQRSMYERVIQPMLTSVAARVMQWMPGAAVENTRAKLETAGNPWSLTPATFLMLRGLSTIAGVLGAAVILVAWRSAPPLNRYGMAALALMIGAMIPDYLLSQRIRTRQYQITKSLPDIIDLLVVSAEAGQGLDGALAEVVRRKKGPLPDEFKRVLTEIRLGKRRNEAWMDMANRCGVDDLKNLVAALHQAEELGVSISNTLRAQSDSLRTRRSMRIRTAAATLSVKMLFPLIFCIFPALFVVVLGPGVMSIDAAMKGMGW
jgi:tight adherence protein C